MKAESPDRIPVLVGVGEVIDKPHAIADGLEPVALIEQALRRAERDAGAQLLRQIDSLDVVQPMSWGYRDLAQLAAQRIGAAPAHLIDGPIGGETPVRFLAEAAARIARGESKFAAICGAEALRTLIKGVEAGTPPAWSDPDPEHGILRGEDHVSALAARYGLCNPVDVYPLYENACRAAWGQSFSEAQAESGWIWSAMSDAAARYPYAWSPRAMRAEDIVTPGTNNRTISFPYQKFMVAQIGVNQGAAVIVTSVAEARAAGIAEDRWVYVWAGAGASEPDDFLARDRYNHAPALDRVLRRTLQINALQTADIDLYELYSCFPCVPKLSRRSLGLPVETPFTTIGGLTFFGGPGNNYMTHAIAGMVHALRAGRGRAALLHGNGAYVTKHYAAVLSLAAPPPTVSVCALDLQAEADAAYGTVPALATDYQGVCTIETYMANFDRNGNAQWATVIVRTAQGQRSIARVTQTDDGDTLNFLVAGREEPVGRKGFLYAGSDGRMHFSLVNRAALRA